MPVHHRCRSRVSVSRPISITGVLVWVDPAPSYLRLYRIHVPGRAASPRWAPLGREPILSHDEGLTGRLKGAGLNRPARSCSDTCQLRRALAAEVSGKPIGPRSASCHRCGS